MRRADRSAARLEHSALQILLEKAFASISACDIKATLEFITCSMHVFQLLHFRSLNK